MYSDEHIEHYGRLFVANDLHRRTGLRFETFMRDPEHWLQHLVWRETPADEAPRPLLSAQRQVQARVDMAILAEEAAAEVERRAQLRGAHMIEPLKHHTMPWKR